jgi:hypothetical protein
MRLIVALRAFFRVLFQRSFAQRVAALLDEPTEGTSPQPQEAAPAAQRPRGAAVMPGRSEALTLLAALQREARFVDFVQENLDGYPDAQVGAAVRDVHRACRQVLQRMFALQPVVAQPEGTDVELPEGYDAGRFHLTGKPGSTTRHRGRLVHHGWEASICQVPQWTGTPESARVVAPAEVEIPPS